MRVDIARGLRDGQAAADLYIRSDALAGVEAILAGLDKKLGAGKPTAATIRTKELAHRIATEPADSMEFDIEPGVLDPRKVIDAIDAVVPKDWDVVVGGGHQAYFNAQMRGRPAERYTTVREFGAVGNGLLALRRRAGRAATARSCCSKETAGFCSISRNSRRSSARGIAC